MNMNMMQNVPLTLNGERRTVRVPVFETLLETLRERFGVTSPKCGCGQGDCGACTVLLDEKSVRSCLILTVEATGHEVTTLEGAASLPLPDGRTVAALQAQLVAENAFQCGYCAPGIIMTLVDFLQRNPRPTRAELQHALTGNLCRCTGYGSILDAILTFTETRPEREVAE